MILKIDSQVADAKSRMVANRVLSFVLRLMAMWRERRGSYPEIMVLIAVVVITSDRLTRSDDALLKDISNPIPIDRIGRCNFASLAAATGLNRETVRRVVGNLVDEGLLVRTGRGLVHFADGYIQQGDAAQLNRHQIEEFTRTANILLKDGVLAIDP